MKIIITLICILLVIVTPCMALDNSATISGTLPNAITMNNAGNSFTGNGSGLSSLTAANLTGTVPLAALGASIVSGDLSGTVAAPSVATVGGFTSSAIATSVGVTQAATSANTVSTVVKRDGSGNFTAGTVTATSFAGSGASLTSLNANNVSAGTLSGAFVNIDGTTIKNVGGQLQATGTSDASTNGTTVVYTNLAINTLYTNNYGGPITVQGLSVVYNEAAVAGASAVSLSLTNGALTTNINAQQITAVGIATGAMTNAFTSFIVTNGGTFQFRDVSSGLGNSANILGMQITYVQQLCVATSFVGNGNGLTNLPSVAFSFTNAVATSATTNYTILFGATCIKNAVAAGNNVCFKSISGPPGDCTWMIFGTNGVLVPTNCFFAVTNWNSIQNTNYFWKGTNGTVVTFNSFATTVGNTDLSNIVCTVTPR